MTPSTDSLPQALAGIRVLELAGPSSQYCGKLFAELGADVILIEPPGGSALRSEPPFIADRPGADRSLTFGYLNTSKRGVTLELGHPAGQSVFRELAATADLVIDTTKPGTMSRWACDYAALAARRRQIVVTSITAFGQTGPYALYEAEDLIALAAGGFLYLGGYTDSPPVGAYGNQAYHGASLYGAVASMLALTGAEISGEGEHVDVSMQECMVMALENAVQFYDLEGKVRKRHADVQRWAGTGVFECRDGHIYMMASGIGVNKFWPLSLQWLVDERVPGVERLQGDEWNAVEYVITDEAKKIFAEVFSPWAMTRTKAYLFAEGQRRHIPLAAINRPDDLMKSAQLAHREFFVSLAHPEADAPLTMPGAPYRLAATPWRLRGPAPRAGEHNAAVYGELGIDARRLAGLVEQGAV